MLSLQQLPPAVFNNEVDMKNDATLRLFNGIQVDEKNSRYPVDEDLLKRTIKNGYILDPAIAPDKKLLKEIEKIAGISGEKANASFHKSWSVIRDTPREALWMQAIIHYMTTYGFESMGIYSEDTVYIPHEKLDIPEIKNDIPLIVIRAMTSGEILERIIQLGGSGIALMRETLDDILSIIAANSYEGDFAEQIKNRELKALLYDHYGMVPREPVEFLRHLISKLTDESLIIKNDYLIEKIKGSNGKFLDELLKKAPDDLASIFFRFKPLFLAMKSISRNRSYFNRLRKQADKLHKPLPEDFLNSITARIKNNALDLKKLEEKLREVPVFRKIRLAYALKFREDAGDSIVYRVRNGSGWATDFNWEGDTGRALDLVTDSVIKDIRKKAEGRTIYLPEGIHYALPATEKQFTGFFPTGSYISIPEDMIVGIHWFNTGEKRVDLDLSTISAQGKTGWDSSYTSEGKNVLFSGDMTDAPEPDGASELFYFKEGSREPKIMLVNYFNFNPGDEVEAKIIVAREKPQNFGGNYMVDPNNLIATANVNIRKKQNILGLIVNVEGDNRFYFANINIGNSVTAYRNDHSAHARRYLVKRMVGSLDFRNILEKAGAVLVTEKPGQGSDFIDLSPEGLDKSSIIDLVV